MLTHWSVAQAGSNNEKSRLKFSLDCPFKPKKPHTLHTSILSTGKYIAKFLEFITMCAFLQLATQQSDLFKKLFFSRCEGVFGIKTLLQFFI